MTKLFANFWNIDLGHVVVGGVFIFGLGVSWATQTDAIREVRTLTETRTQAVAVALDHAVSERNLKIAAVVERLTKDEEAIRAVGSFDREIGILSTQIKALTAEVASLRQELREYQPQRKSAD